MEGTNVDVFGLALQLIFNSMKGGNFKEDVKYYFNLAEEIKEEAIERNYIKAQYCKKCNGEIKHINLNDQWRVKCECKEAIGKTEQEAYIKWRDK